jgi:ankyrin repeat protein
VIKENQNNKTMKTLNNKANNGSEVFKNGLDRKLMDAVALGNNRAVILLLELGANPNTGNGRPLKDAVDCGFTNIVETLLEYGADVKANNCVAIKRAVFWQRFRVLDMLLENFLTKKIK